MNTQNAPANLSNSKLRIITALLGLSLVLTLYFWLGQLGVKIIISFISIVTYYEFLDLLLDKKQIRWMYQGKKLLSLSLAAFTIYVFTWDQATFFMPLFVALYCFLAFGLICSHFSPAIDSAPFLEKQFQETIMQGFGLFYIVGFLSYVPAIHAQAEGGIWLLFLLLIIWGGDTVAYFAGRKFGKRKLSPAISPGKTLEGAAVSLLWSMLIGLILAALSQGGWQGLLLFPFIGILCSAAGQAGDLIESWIKRTVYAKDSGSIMPGHGGMFDRFDSLIFAAPVYYYLLEFFVVK